MHTQVRQCSSDTTGARSAAVAGHPTRQVGKDRNVAESCQCVAGRTGDHSEVDDDGAKRGSAADGTG